MKLYLKTYQLAALLLFILLFSYTPFQAQKQETGGIKGKVRDENRKELAGVTITVIQGDREIASATSNKTGDFKLQGIAIGVYRMTFSKSNLSLGTLASVKVRAGTITELDDRLILYPDEGSLAFIRGSVFDPNGRSVKGAKIELHRVFSNGSSKRLKESASSVDGQFAFRLDPDNAKYRVTVKYDGAETISKDVIVEGAAIYRVAVSLEPKKN